MFISAMVTSLPGNFEDAVRRIAKSGFSHVDMVGKADRPEHELAVLAETGLLVSCVAVGRDFPQDCTLDSSSVSKRRTALEEIKLHIADAARLGATHCYLIPGLDSSPQGLAFFTEACCRLAEEAGRRMVRMCVEHIPGRALPTATSVLDWLNRLQHANLALLLDVGHCLISNEDPVQIVNRAGKNLGYLHFDDNDGASDLHWPLLEGRLTEDQMKSLVATLQACDYHGALALELNPKNQEPLKALEQGKTLLQKWLGSSREGRFTSSPAPKS
jgi:sugar phosphate isomerase/epimerase